MSKAELCQLIIAGNCLIYSYFMIAKDKPILFVASNASGILLLTFFMVS
jgi:hypothetical protein